MQGSRWSFTGPDNPRRPSGCPSRVLVDPLSLIGYRDTGPQGRSDSADRAVPGRPRHRVEP